jgi:hypothetical protein|tara:strand:- start:3973 stop:4104 length:132 start_codon:yes stop_codon:yes gene_type:complete
MVYDLALPIETVNYLPSMAFGILLLIALIMVYALAYRLGSYER